MLLFNVCLVLVVLDLLVFSCFIVSVSALGSPWAFSLRATLQSSVSPHQVADLDRRPLPLVAVVPMVVASLPSPI